jgi:hypothetical protein
VAEHQLLHVAWYPSFSKDSSSKILRTAVEQRVEGSSGLSLWVSRSKGDETTVLKEMGERKSVPGDREVEIY